MIRPRCSSLDRIFACPGSILPTDAPPEAGGPDAVLGSARHECLSAIPVMGIADFDKIAAKYGVEVEDLEIAMKFGREAWADELAIYFPNPMVERLVESSVCRGTLDFGAVVMERDGFVVTDNPVVSAIRVADWKTGYGTEYHPAQLKGYAHCLVEEFGFPTNGVVTIFEVWTSHREMRTTNLTEVELTEFAGRLAQIIEVAENEPERLEYRAGGHCRFCSHRVGCETRQRFLQDSTTALVAVDHGQAITRDTLGRLYLKAQEVDQAMRRFWSAVDLALEDGPLQLPDGRRVEKVTTEREKINTGLAMGALMDAGILDPSDQDAQLELMGDLPKKRLSDWAKRIAGKGEKAALMRKIYKALHDADAIRTVPHRQKKILDAESE
jgi:CRISPR/Cas system-associated exonuclease Cas4 (RecB family)